MPESGINEPHVLFAVINVMMWPGESFYSGNIGRTEVRVLVIGAGASVEEAQRVGLAEQFHPPLMKGFADKLWRHDSNSYRPNVLMRGYLEAHDYLSKGDPTDTFVELERAGADRINVERFFEYAWRHRDEYPSQYMEHGEWGNLVYHGIASSLVFLLRHFFENGVGWKPLSASQMVARHLSVGDLVVNLNYDTLFELGAKQTNRHFVYVPNKPSVDSLRIAKPHGSLNLIVNNGGFAFGQPEFIHMVLQPGEDMGNLRGIVPPRFNKAYNQHPVARVIFDEIRGVSPTKLTFWGIGLSDSDADLTELYQRWANTAECEMINPNRKTESVARAQEILGAPVQHFLSIEDWLAVG